jgi:hypothetical protein
MRSTRKYGRRNRRRLTKKNRLYGGADQAVPPNEILQHLFDTSPNKNSSLKKNPNKFTVEVRKLDNNVDVKKLFDNKDLPPYIIKITDASNNSVYCASTQDFKETINKKFKIIGDGMKNLKFTRKNKRNRIVDTARIVGNAVKDVFTRNANKPENLFPVVSQKPIKNT